MKKFDICVFRLIYHLLHCFCFFPNHSCVPGHAARWQRSEPTTPCFRGKRPFQFLSTPCRENFISLSLMFCDPLPPREIRKKYHLASCIGSTRIVIDVLARYGIHAVPRAVTTRVEKGGAVGSWLGSFYERATRGLWKGTCAGHVVAVIPERNLLIDASIDQVCKRAPSLQPPCPFVAEVGDDFICRKGEHISCLTAMKFVTSRIACPNASARQRTGGQGLLMAR